MIKKTVFTSPLENFSTTRNGGSNNVITSEFTVNEEVIITGVETAQHYQTAPLRGFLFEKIGSDFIRLARSEETQVIVDTIKRLDFITPVKIYPGKTYYIGVGGPNAVMPNLYSQTGVRTIKSQDGITFDFVGGHYNGGYALGEGKLTGNFSNFMFNFLIHYIDERPPVTGKLRDQAPGRVVKFADSLWTILEPSTGLSLKTELEPVKLGIGPNNGSRIDVITPGYVGHYLNNDFLNNFSTQEKSVILKHRWGIGALQGAEAGNNGVPISKDRLDTITNKEKTTTIEMLVGILSISEFHRYYSVKGHGGPLTGPDVVLWTRTPDSNNWRMGPRESLSGQSPWAENHFQAAVYINPETNLKDGTVVHNAAPTITVNTPNNQTLYENDTLTINGTAKDTDNGNVVIVRYQINSGTVVAIETKVSTGASIPFSRQFTFKGGKLHYDGVAITGALAEGTAHKLKVWADDDQGGQSEIAERTFYVVPNRAPSLTIDPFESLSDLIDVDRVTMSGNSHDPDGNDVIVRYRINNGINKEIHSGPAGPWSFDFPLSRLKDGENTIVVEVVDTFDSKYSLTRKLNKTANLTPLAQSVQRYTIVPPAGSAQGVLFWVKRDESQDVSIEISMTNGTEPENFVPMTLDSSGPDGIGTVEDFFKYRADVPAEKIAIKLSWTGDKPIHQIQGALTQ